MSTLSLNSTSVPASLSKLNMSNVKKPTQQTPVQMRRNKLSKQLWEQVQLATALASGGSFAPIRIRTVKDKLTGELKTVEQPKRVKPWWFTAEDGSVCLQVRYGVQVLEIGKGKNTITLTSKDQLVETLNLVKQAAENGELDRHIAAVATQAQLHRTK
jgi:hypothetical protein